MKSPSRREHQEGAKWFSHCIDLTPIFSIRPFPNDFGAVFAWAACAMLSRRDGRQLQVALLPVPRGKQFRNQVAEFPVSVPNQIDFGFAVKHGRDVGRNLAVIRV